MPLARHVSNDVHILCDTSDTRVTIHGHDIDVQVLDHIEDGLELWSPILTAPFPIDREQVARLFDEWPLTMPRLHHERFMPLPFLTHVVSATSGLRIVGVSRTYRRAVVDGCLIERATIAVAGHRAETASVAADESDRVRRVLSAYQLDRYDNLNDVNYLKRLIGMQPLRQTAHLAATA